MVYLSRLLRFSLVMVALVAVTAGSLVIVAPQFAKLVGAHRSDHERLSLEPLAERSYIIDSQGNTLGTLINAENENRVPVEVEDVPDTVTGAILAAEDEDFYLHKGINLRSIGRAVDANLDSGSASQGGSTITQQVVKNSLVGDDQDLSRKIREAFLAVELEKQMSKDEILERYLNSVYFGGGAYGVQAASEYYFNKDVVDLNWAEGALLASLIRSPNTYDPFKNPELSAERRTIVFDRLLETERLTEDEVLGIGGENVKGFYSAMKYFQSLDNANNQKFVKSFKEMWGPDSVIGDVTQAAYLGPWLWKEAVEKAGSFDVDKVVAASPGLELKTAPEGYVKIHPNHHLWSKLRVGQWDANGQAKVVYESDLIEPNPFPAGYQ